MFNHDPTTRESKDEYPICAVQFSIFTINWYEHSPIIITLTKNFPTNFVEAGCNEKQHDFQARSSFSISSLISCI